MARRFRFETEQEIKEAGNWATAQDVPLGWGWEQEILELLGTEITDPIHLQICQEGGSFSIPSDSIVPTAYYVEIKQEETMKRYRFKTKEEFGRDMPIEWVPQMLPNLGKELTEITPEIVEAIAQGKYFKYKGGSNCKYGYKYSYRYSDTVEIEEPKRIPKEEWEDICLYTDIIGVETQNGDKFYLVENVDGFVNINLKKHTTSEYSDSGDIESGLRQCLGDVGKKVYQFNSMQELIKWATT